MEQQDHVLISIGLLSLLAGFFFVVGAQQPPASDMPQTRLGFQSRGLIMDPGEVTDMWTGKSGIDVTIIAIAQERVYTDAISLGYSVSEPVVEEYLRQSLAKNNQTLESWESNMSDRGIPVSDVRHHIRKLLIANQYIKDLVTPAINVTMEEIESFYEQNKHKFKPLDPRLNGTFPQLHEVIQIINSTILNRKIKTAGQEFVTNLLNATAQQTIIAAPSGTERITRNQLENLSGSNTSIIPVPNGSALQMLPATNQSRRLAHA